MVVARGAHVDCSEPLSSAAQFRLQSGIRGSLLRTLHFLMLEQEGGHFDFSIAFALTADKSPS
jgi:hypothetical protein